MASPDTSSDASYFPDERILMLPSSVPSSSWTKSIWGKFPVKMPTHAECIFSALPEASKALRTNVFKDLRQLVGLDDLPQDTETVVPIDSNKVQVWIESKIDERDRLLNKLVSDPQWQDITQEHRDWKLVGQYARTAVRDISSLGPLKDINVTLSEQYYEFEKANRAVRSEIAGVAAALMGFRGPGLAAFCYLGTKATVLTSDTIIRARPWANAANVPGTCKMIVPPAPPTVEFDPAQLRQKSWSSSSSLFKMTLEDSPTDEERFRYYFTYGEQLITSPPPDAKVTIVAPFQSHIPDWFYLLDRYGKTDLGLPTIAQRWTSLCNQIHALETQMANEEYAKKMKSSGEATKNCKWDKEYHDPHPGWLYEIRRKNGGWWKCRSGEGAPLRERRCRLCHDPNRVIEGQDEEDITTTKEDYDGLMAVIDKAMKIVAKRDKKAVLERLRRADLERPSHTATQVGEEEEAPARGRTRSRGLPAALGRGVKFEYEEDYQVWMWLNTDCGNFKLPEGSLA